ncbi:flavin reductase family protein [Microbacterium sp. NPDC089696]|uniref:flavin reductase family protein n=1 Tax=Microbacterium sp. NPDC089696 TaxID=3364199 RepID=UPI0038250B80
MAHRQVKPPIHYVGTPVMLFSTSNEDGTANLAPASSYWALGDMVVLGLEDSSMTAANLLRHGEITINFPSPDLVPAIEALGDVTGMLPVPAAKADTYVHVKDKFSFAALTPAPSTHVSPPRVDECDLQLEAVLRRATPGIGGYVIAEVEVVTVHARDSLIIDGTNHIDPRSWKPTIYSYRHYFGLGQDHGRRPSSPLNRSGDTASTAPTKQ